MAIKKMNSLIPTCSSPDDLKRVLQTLGSTWGDVVEDLESLEVVPLKGAMTNEVYQINWPTLNGGEDALHRRVLVRIYGDGVDLFFNRDDEIKTFECMSHHGYGPKLLGRFSDGRLEEFIHARTLSAGDLRVSETSDLIAAKLREFHKLDMPGPKNILLWERLRSWLKEAKNLCSPTEMDEFRLEAMEDEINLLEERVTRDDQEIGFCHNDLQYGNVMIDEETNAITIIDYEYSSFNPIAYDIANHFCEMAANYHSDTPHVLDYTLYPGEEERRRFISTYLGSTGNATSEEEVERLMTDAERYTLANHIFWGLWGIISGHVNTIEFDYKEYARQRFEQYWLRKQLLLD
ncbi:choline kinase 1 [Hirschfeldia incana]|nr:choline kinase 1 [Hirschfeldia incana]